MKPIGPKQSAGRYSFSSGLNAVCLIFVLGASPGAARAADALTYVPADVAGVLSFRNIEECNQKLTSFVRLRNEGFIGLDITEFAMILGMDAGHIDTAQPIHAILSHPREFAAFLTGRGIGEAGTPFPLIAFTPRQPSDFMKRVKGFENRAFSQSGPFGQYYLLMRDGIAYVANTKKHLRMLKRVDAGDGLADTFDEDQKSFYARNDVVLHLPLSRWRDKVDFYVFFITNLMQLGIIAQQNPENVEQTRAIAEWFIGGIREAVKQMDAITLALDFDGTTFRFDHHHTFAEGQWVSDYLKQVGRADVDLWTSLPDRPFFMLAVANWLCPPEVSLTGRFSQFYFDADFSKKEMSPKERKKLSDCLMNYIGQTRGMEFMLTSPPGQFFPVQILGSETVEDAPKALEQFRFILENADEMMSAFLSGRAKCDGNFKECRRDGVQYLEMPLDFPNMAEEMRRRQVVCFHGEKARYQQAAITKTRLVYAIAEPPQSVTDLMNVAKSGRNVNQNVLVQRIRSRLQGEANVAVVMDVGRVLGMLPHMMQANLGMAGKEVKLPIRWPDDDKLDKSGPLLGWSCRVRDRAVHCRWAIDAQDALEAFQLVKFYTGTGSKSKKAKYKSAAR